MRMQFKFGAAILAAVLLGAGASPAMAQKSADTLRIVDARRAAEYRSLLQQSAHRRGDASPGLGRAGLPQSRHLQARAAARDRMEAARSDHDRVHAAPGREIPRRQPVHRRRRGLHAQSRVRPGQQGVDARELQLDRQGGEDRRALGARQAQAADTRGARIFRAGDADLSESLSREGRARRAMPRRRSAPAPTRSPRSSPASRSTSSGSRTTGPAARRASRRSRR